MKFANKRTNKSRIIKRNNSMDLTTRKYIKNKLRTIKIICEIKIKIKWINLILLESKTTMTSIRKKYL